MQKPHCRPWLSMRPAASDAAYRRWRDPRPPVRNLLRRVAGTANIRHAVATATVNDHGAGAAVPCSQPYGYRVCRSSRGWRRRACGAARRRSHRAVMLSVMVLVMTLFSLGPQSRADTTATSPAFRRSRRRTASRVVDGIDDRRRRADGAAFAQTFGPGDRLRARRFHMIQFVIGGISRAVGGV